MTDISVSDIFREDTLPDEAEVFRGHSGIKGGVYITVFPHEVVGERFKHQITGNDFVFLIFLVGVATEQKKRNKEDCVGLEKSHCWNLCFDCCLNYIDFEVCGDSV